MKNGDTPAIETVTSHSSITKSGCYLPLSDLIIPTSLSIPVSFGFVQPVQRFSDLA